MYRQWSHWGATTALAALLVLVAAFGCGKRAGPTLYSVTGTVTYKGQPLEGANVVFRAVSGTASGAGRTRANGQYEISSQWGKGLPEGDYLVTVTKFRETVPQDEEPAGPAGGEPDVDMPTPKSLVPMKYAVAETSGLKATVKAGAKTYDFDLAD